MKSNEFTLLKKELLNDVINNISIELQQKRIDRNFIKQELNILKDMCSENNENKELFRGIDKLPKELWGVDFNAILTAYFKVLSSEFNYDYETLICKNKKSIYVKRRAMFVYVVYNALHRVVSLKEIGLFLGGKDHTTILNARRIAENWIECNDFNFVEQVFQSIASLKKANLKTGELEFKTKILIAKNKRNKICQLPN